MINKSKLILLLYVLLGSIFLGIIAHETVHVVQFGFNVKSIGILWGSSDIDLPLPKTFVQSNTYDVILSDPFSLEFLPYLIQMIVTILSMWYGSKLV